MFQITTLDLDELPKTEDGKVDYAYLENGKVFLSVNGNLHNIDDLHLALCAWHRQIIQRV